ncbi:MAG: winged helix-turn-helix domain-containing protein [Planctomycetota bacterium]|nr:winged helix-turn-helix domain-containing protein [Planctomycetota bacterium]
MFVHVDVIRGEWYSGNVSADAVRYGGNAAIVFSVILPWFELNANGRSKLRVEIEGQDVRANTHKQLAKETGLSVTQVKRAIANLRDAGVITVRYKKFAGKRTSHVAIDFEALKRAWLAATGNSYDDDDDADDA